MEKYPNVPATPIYWWKALGVTRQLIDRTRQTTSAQDGLSNEYTIDGRTKTAHNFMYKKAGILEKVILIGEAVYNLATCSLNRQQSTSSPGFRGSSPCDEDTSRDISEFDLDKLNPFIEDLENLEKEFLSNPDFDVDELDAFIEGLENLEKELSKHPDPEQIFNDSLHVYANTKNLPNMDEESANSSDDEGAGSNGFRGSAGSEVPLTKLSLDHPEQWAMGWTKYDDVYQDSQNMLPVWSSTLTNADEATKQFWPMIATYGLVYNLLVLQKVGETQHEQLKTLFEFDDQLNTKVDNLQKAGRLYAIDLSVFEVLKPNQAKEGERFTPSTITLLQQDADSKVITPLAIRVAGHEGTNAQVYLRDEAAGEKQATDSAWLYALQAAKTSVTVYGIWLGHVYHWHIVTAAMQMTMNTAFTYDHAIYKLLAPQSECLIGFDTLLLCEWNLLAPPTSINSGGEYLELCNAFAKDRGFFDDDPLTTLGQLGIEEADFTKTKDKPWELYPIVPRYLKIWEATENYVGTFVSHNYENDKKVEGDEELQEWIRQSKNPSEGNVRDLPEKMDSREKLKQVLTSLIYRITMHGASRLNSHALPALSFVANFPPCLQSSAIPEPSASFDTKTLLSYLPKTGTIGGMLNFYFIFVFSKPYKAFIPKDRDSLPADLQNKNFHNYQKQVKETIELIENSPPNNPWPKKEGLREELIHQWPLNIET